ncbi:MAG: Uma2 family endonuclease [Caldilineaceae bacterium]
MSSVSIPNIELPITQDIPTHLIYEMAEEPIYYHGYQDVLRGLKKTEEIMGSSFLQSFLISILLRYLMQHLPETYIVLTNELGWQFPGGKWRAADIALYQREQLHGVPLHNHYLDIPPQVVIEVDTQADLTQFNTPLDYYYTKTDALLDFGVQKVIWVFTDARKVMVAEKAQDWLTRNWESEVEILPNLTVNLAQLIEQQTF